MQEKEKNILEAIDDLDKILGGAWLALFRLLYVRMYVMMK